MSRKEGACLLCGASIVYFKNKQKMDCSICGKKLESHAACESGHYICDTCHAQKGIEVIIAGCRETASRNPIEIMQKLMENPYIYMHGPEHHVMAGAALLAAYHNSGGVVDLVKALREMEARGSQVPGGVCGLWGCCGAGISTGIFMSIITGTTPLSGKSWGLSNKMTARALMVIGESGGPRCCKRDCFSAVREAAQVVEEELGVAMELPDVVICGFSEENEHCLRRKCPFHLSNNISIAKCLDKNE